MHSKGSDFEPLVALANEYLERCRRGEAPSIAEYADRHPDLATRILEVFPMMLLMEEHAPAENDEKIESHAIVGGIDAERIGEFRILREVGRGGMGVVYEAIQESLGRHVALKVLPTNTRLNPSRRERFKRESRTAAMLHHTNIVPVFSVGEEDGMFYYAMQFIRGAGLDEVIDELRRLRPERNRATRPGESQSGCSAASYVAQSMIGGRLPEHESAIAHRAQSGVDFEQSVEDANSSSASGVQLPGQSGDASLSDAGQQYWRSAAQIGVQVADALDYAHRKRTLHRDIKPSNLLLDENTTVWVMDFGLAKWLEQDDLTNTGELVGTMRYMSPEQFQGATDARSDVYSLGLTLYELLTLRPAFDQADRDALMRAITFEEPPRPRKLNPQIPRDLETIVLKAIAREPRSRYSSAGELAADLTRYLNNEPVQARPISATERIAKWARRRPAIATLSVALVLVTVVGFLGVTWQWRRAAAAYEKTSAALARESESHAQSKAARRDAESAKDEADRQAQLAKKIAVFLASQLNGTDMIGMATYLDDADPEVDGNQTPLEMLDKATHRVTNELEGAPEIQARLMDTLGVVYFGRGFLHKAEGLFEQSLQLRTSEAEVDRELVARSQLNLGCTRFLYGYYGEAELLISESLQTRREVLGEDHKHTRLAQFLLTWIRLDRDESNEALALFEEQVREVTKLRQGRFGEANRDLAFGLGYLAIHYHRKQDYETARRLLFEASALLPKDGFSTDYFIQSGEAIYRIHMNQPDRLPELCDKIAANLKEDFGNDSFVGLVFAEMGKGARALNRPKIAELLFQRAAIDVRTSLGRCPRTARITALYGELLLQRGEMEAGHVVLKEAWDILRETLGEQHPETIAVGRRLVDVARSRENLAAKMGTDIDARHGELTSVLAKGFARSSLGQGPQAFEAYREALELSGAKNSAALLTGRQDYLEAPHVPLDKYDSFTIEMWVRNWRGFLFYLGGPEESGIQFTPARGAMYSGRIGANYRYSRKHPFSLGELAQGKWHHLALVYDGSRLLTFVDGDVCDEVALQGAAPGPFNPQRKLWIGRHPQPYRRSSGQIRSLRVSTVARYRMKFSAPVELPSDEDTVLLFDFSNPLGRLNGAAIPDLSGCGNNGVLQNAWWLR